MLSIELKFKVADRDVSIEKFAEMLFGQVNATVKHEIGQISLPAPPAATVPQTLYPINVR